MLGRKIRLLQPHGRYKRRAGADCGCAGGLWDFYAVGGEDG